MKITPKHRRVITQFLSISAVIFSLAVVLVAAAPQGHAFVKTALFLPQILPTLPLKPQSLVTKTPTREEVRYPIADGEGLADIYVPGSGANHSAVLLFLGVNPAGRDDPRVVGLADALARSGAVVMIPWSDSMTQRRIALEEVDNLVYAFEFLRAHDAVDPDRVGMGGFCVGASLSAVAAQDPRIRDDVRFINFFGGYYDAFDLVKSVVSKSRFSDDFYEGWSPNYLSVEVVSTHLIEGVSDLEERLLLEKIFLQREVGLEVDPESLSTEAASVYKLLSGPDIGEVDELIQQLPEDTIESLRFISPSTRINDLKARVLIMHDREDDLVPSEESRRLEKALGANGRTYYTEFSLFQHVDPTKVVSPPEFARESFKLFLHLYNVMRELT